MVISLFNEKAIGIRLLLIHFMVNHMFQGHHEISSGLVPKKARNEQSISIALQ